jgi:RecA-family ATPase
MSATKTVLQHETAAAKAEAAYCALIASTRARELDVGAMITSEPAPHDYIFGVWSLTAGSTGLVYAPGDTGKSYLALTILSTLACAGVGGVKYDPLQLRPRATAGGWKCLYITGEDSTSEVWHRLYRVGSAAGRAGREAIGRNLRVVSTQGLWERLLVTDDPLRDLAIAGGHERRLIVFDTLTRFHSQDENSNPAMAAVISRFESIACATGAAVLVLHHCNKSSMSGGSTSSSVAIRGAASIRDNCRWALAVSSASGVRVLHEDKHNDGAAHANVYARWADEGGPFIACDAPRKGGERATTWNTPGFGLAEESGDEPW